MNRMPWFQFFPADWIKGTRELSISEKGIWIDLLSYMWEAPQRGQIVSTWEGIARMIGITWLDCETAINAMRDKGLFEVTFANGKVTLSSRRMKNEQNSRDSNRIRQREFKKRKNNTEVTRETSEVRSQKTEKTLPCGLPVNDTDKATAEDLVKLWNKEAHPNLPRVKFLTETRKRHANARLQANPQQSFWTDLISKVNLSPLLRGEAGNWKANFDWILNPSNLAKILEGNYDANKRR